FFVCELLHDKQQNAGHPIDTEARQDAQILRGFGWSHIADLIDELYDLVAELDRKDVCPDESDQEPAGAAALDREMSKMRIRWRQAVGEVLGADFFPDPDDLSEHYDLPDEQLIPPFASALGVKLIEQADFDRYWIERILRSPAFQDIQSVQSRLGYDMTDGLTDKLIAILSAKGYDLDFVFWRRASRSRDTGRVRKSGRGQIYAQTSKGPIVVVDTTDEVSLRTYFPVEIFALDGSSILTITEADDLGTKRSSWIAKMLRSFSGRD
ncbi:MAG: hypothetical protein AAF686_07620, partial [Pseudomonadota bacterium]